MVFAQCILAKNKLFYMKKHNLLRIGIIFVSFLIFSSCTSSSSKNDLEKAHIKLKLEIEDINKQCPVVLTSYIQLDSCALLPNNYLVNYYKLGNPNDYTIDGLKVMENEMRHQIKTDPSMSQMRDYGAILAYKYFDSENKLVFSFEVTPEEYNKTDK